MESTLHKIRFEYKKFGPSERKVADYILKNEQEVTSLPINELARLSGSTAATIVRFARRIGFEGFTDFKIGLAGEMVSTSAISSRITKDDSCFEIFGKRINDISVSLHNTESVLDPKQLELAAKTIMKANRIAIFGLGNSAAIAQDAAHKFLRLGLKAQACTDNHMQAIIASHLDRDSVAIGISHSGSSTDIIDALQLSKIGNAKTVCITNYADSPIVENSDICLFTKSDETNHSILAMSSRIAQLAIHDTIYTYIVLNADKASINAIYNTEAALESKKIR
ncbi:MAG: MurR/RpiR family transcriptional regulator [Clostridia bacterium]|nr:MurR/RpiR family transcriptional regulator [Clostridia bacterium]